MNHTDLIIRAARRIDATAAFTPGGGVQLSRHGGPIGDFDEDGAVEALLPLVRMRRELLAGWLDQLIDELAKAAGEPDTPAAAPDDWAGRVYDHENGALIYVNAACEDTRFVKCADYNGYRCAYLKYELEADWTRLANHPMATDPPRHDGLGWREGDEYVWAFYDGCATIHKLRGGAVVARYPLPPSPDCRARTGGKYGQRLNFTPQWEAVTPDEPDADEPIPCKPSKWAPGAVEAGEFPKHNGPSGAVYGRSDPVDALHAGCGGGIDDSGACRGCEAALADMAQRNAAARQGSEPAATSPGQAAYDAYHGHTGIALTWYELPAALKDHWETASKAAIDAYIDAKSLSRRLTAARAEAHAEGMRDMWKRCCAVLGNAADVGTTADPASRDFYAGIGHAGNLVWAMRVTDEEDEREARSAAARAGAGGQLVFNDDRGYIQHVGAGCGGKVDQLGKCHGCGATFDMAAMVAAPRACVA